MTMERHGRLGLAVHNETAPTEAEWEQWLQLANGRIGQDIRAMVEVYGAIGPNARQRQASTRLVGKVDARFAVLSNSLVVRGLVTALSWIGFPNVAFSPGQHEAAASYLELTPEELTLALDRLAVLRRAAGVTQVPKASHPRRSSPGASRS